MPPDRCRSSPGFLREAARSVDVQIVQKSSAPDQIGTEPGTPVLERRHLTPTDERTTVARTIHQQIRAAVANTANRPIPTSWLKAQPALATYRSRADIVAAVRSAPGSPVTDETLRSLLRISRLDGDATTVILDAILPTVSRCIGRTAHPMFYDDVLTELTMVILEADTDNLIDQVARRLAKRAVRRSLRRVEIENRHRDGRLNLDEGFDSPVIASSVEDQALQRTELTEIARTITGAIDAGRLTSGTWTAFLDGKVLPAVSGERLHVDRRKTFSATQMVRRQLAHIC